MSIERRSHQSYAYKHAVLLVATGCVVAGLFSTVLLAQLAAPKNVHIVAIAAPKPVLTQNDVALVGAFDLPTCTLRGFTIRYIGNVRHFLINCLDPGHGSGNHVYRLNDPGTAANSPYPSAFSEIDYGTNMALSAHLPNDPGGDKQLWFSGLYWDETLQRLYWNYQNSYGSCATDYSFGASTVNDATATVSDVGCWGFDQNQRRTNTGILPVPSWFANQYLSAGQRLAAGFGGYQAGFNACASHGPSLTAFAPDTGTNSCGDPFAAIRGTPMFAYDSIAAPYGNPHPAQTTQLNQWTSIPQDLWNPNGGYGYWLWGTLAKSQIMAWPDTDARTGIVAVVGMQEGRFNATVVPSPPPTTTSATLSTVQFTDGSRLKNGDVINVQVDTSLTTNCNGSADVRVASVSGNTVTFQSPVATGGDCKMANGADCPASQAPFITGQVQGGVYYCNATIKTTRWRHRWLIYDPADLAAVVRGKKQPYDPIPKAEWNVAYDGLPDPDMGIMDAFFHTHYVVWDPKVKQILVAIDDASGPPLHRPRVYVHSIP